MPLIKPTKFNLSDRNLRIYLLSKSNLLTYEEISRVIGERMDNGLVRPVSVQRIEQIVRKQETKETLDENQE